MKLLPSQPVVGPFPTAPTRVGRVDRPQRATHFQLVTMPAPAASIPSTLPHVVVNGLPTIAAVPTGVGGVPVNPQICQWDYLEHPQLYGQWIPLPDAVRALELLNGANPGATGTVTQGSVLWAVEEERPR